MKTKSNIHVFYHLATGPHWRSIWDEMMQDIIRSGLYDKATSIQVGVIGPEAEHFQVDESKVEIRYRSLDISEFEAPTLHLLQKHCIDHPDDRVCYLHSKGVISGAKNPRVTDWRKYMTYFNVCQYEDCITQLDAADVCGVNWYDRPWKHFSGNFWWANASYISTLCDVSKLSSQRPGRISSNPPAGRFIFEWWVGSNPKVEAISLWQSNINHYRNQYPITIYSKEHLLESEEIDVDHYDKLKLIESIPSAWRGLGLEVRKLILEHQPRVIVDLGTDLGYSALAMAIAGVGHVYTIDWFKGDSYSGIRDVETTCRDNIAKAGLSNLTLIKDSFEQAAQSWEQPVDLLHIDGSHAYEQVVSDLCGWWDHLSNNAMILLHDTQSFKDGPGRLFNELDFQKTEIKEHHGLGIIYVDKSRICTLPWSSLSSAIN